MTNDDFTKIVSRIESAKKNTDFLIDFFEKQFQEYYTKKTILGIDIYRYSKLKKSAQSIVPYIFRTIILKTIEDLKLQESSYFTEDIQNLVQSKFINTGDGGYLIFDNPFTALIFSIYFSFNVLLYNTKKMFSNVFEIVGNLSLRYAMTKDDIFYYEDNWYGPAIISCARILQKDKLNRFLLDDNVKFWFDHHFNGIETLLCLGKNNLEQYRIYHEILKESPKYHSIVIPEVGNKPGNSNIININLSKIGIIMNKGDRISIHNLHLQVYLVIMGRNGKKIVGADKFIVTLGNLNVTGI